MLKLTGKNIFEPRHKISNNVVCATSKGSDQPAHTRSLIRAFTSRLDSLWLHTEHDLDLPSLKGGCTGWSKSTLVNITHGNHMSGLISMILNI